MATLIQLKCPDCYQEFFREHCSTCNGFGYVVTCQSGVCIELVPANAEPLCNEHRIDNCQSLPALDIEDGPDPFQSWDDGKHHWAVED